MAEAIYRDIPDGVSRIIGIGGGTVMDLCKLFVLKQVSPILDLFDGKTAVEKEKELILVPTTCGTGSEVTNVSVMASSAATRKRGLPVMPSMPIRRRHFAVVEDLAFPRLCDELHRRLVHAVESALSPDSSASFRVFSYQAIERILSGYLQIRDHGPEARIPLMKDFLLASTWAASPLAFPAVPPFTP